MACSQMQTSTLNALRPMKLMYPLAMAADANRIRVAHGFSNTF